MNANGQTTVKIKPAARSVFQDLQHTFNERTILNAGVILFGKLSAEDKLEAIRQSNAPLKSTG